MGDDSRNSWVILKVTERVQGITNRSDVEKGIDLHAMWLRANCAVGSCRPCSASAAKKNSRSFGSNCDRDGFAICGSDKVCTCALTASNMCNHRNRLIRAWVAGATTTYGYDETVQRVREPSATTTTHYPSKF